MYNGESPGQSIHVLVVSSINHGQSPLLKFVQDGIARSLKIVAADENDHSFQFGMAFQYFCTLVLMIIVQIAYLPGGALAAAAPSRACLTVGAHVLPAFLDFKMRSTPEELPEGYYGLDSSKDVAVAEEQAQQSGDDMA